MKKELFIKACIQVHKEFQNKPPKLSGRNHEQRVKLKPVFSGYATDYLYHRQINKVNYYSAEHIFRLCKILDIYTNEIVSI